MGSPSTAAATGVALREPLPWHDLLQVVETAEDTGYDAVLLPESDGREAFSTLAGLATATSRLRLATGVATITARDARTTAMAAATVAELSGGRFVLGLGSGPVRRLERTRRYVGAVRAFLRGEAVAVEGVAVSPRPLEVTADALIWLAALQGGMVRLAGEVADGVILNWCTPERVAVATKKLAVAAEAAGRDPGGLTVAVYVRACVGQEEPLALAALQAAAARYAAIPHYRRQFEAMGLGEEARAAAALHERPHDGTSSGAEALVRAVCVWGGREPALARLEEYRAAGADLVAVYPVAARDPLSSTMGTVLALAPSPAVEA